MVAKQYKYLGILLNSSLTLSDQINHTIGHVTGKLNSLSLLRAYISDRVAITIYKATILPLIEYANITHSLVSSKQLQKMQRLQNRALRIVYRHISDVNISDLHIRANLGTLAQRAYRQTLCLMYRRAHQSDYYPTVTNDGITRASDKIKFLLPRPTTERFKKFPIYYGASLWDELDSAVQKTDDYCIFKMRIVKRPDLTRFPV